MDLELRVMISGHVGDGLVVRLGDLGGLFQPLSFYYTILKEQESITSPQPSSVLRLVFLEYVGCGISAVDESCSHTIVA